MKENAVVKEISDEEKVKEYLKDNPDFFDSNPDILESMHVPSIAEEKGVVDFQSVLVAKLKKDKTNALHIHKEIVENARANMSNQNRIQTATLVALEAETFEELVEVVTQDFPVLLNVDTVNIIIESTSNEIPFINQSGIRFAKEGIVKKWLNTGDALLQSDINGSEEIFGAGAGLVRSQALIRLEISENTPAGIIAFGSRDPELFQPNQSVDQVGFLSQVVERLFRIWLGIHT